jgi:hypothetical protein
MLMTNMTHFGVVVVVVIANRGQLDTQAVFGRFSSQPPTPNGLV